MLNFLFSFVIVVCLGAVSVCVCFYLLTLVN